jgi:hypothetical protein
MLKQKKKLQKLANEYRNSRKNEPVANGVKSLYQRYIKEREQLLLEIAASVVALDATVDLIKGVHYERITPEMEEAFHLAFPNMELSDLEGKTTEELEGLLVAWKGKYFEVLVRDELNEGQAVGDLQLESGQTAVLAESPTQPGWDLQILNEDGTIDEVYQLKATESLSYVKSALAENPDIDVITTEEVFADPDKVTEQMHSSGIFDSDLESVIENPFVHHAVDYVVPSASIVVITVAEGTKWILGKQSFAYAYTNALEKSVKSTISVGAGTLAWIVTDMGLISVPTTIITRLGLDRYQLMKKLQEKIKERNREIRKIGERYVYR